MSFSKNNAAARAAGIILATLSAEASAQGSVTLYGELDSGLAYVSNVGGHTQYRTTSGLIDGSYWGLTGSEDLGGGLNAVFQLERGFSVTTGEAFVDHPTWVGLESDRFGQLTFGYQYDAIHDYFQRFTLTGGNGGTAFAHPFDNDNANNSYLAANSIKYASPAVGGFSFGGLYAFSNGAGFAQNRAYSIGANYSMGSFNAGAAWLHNNGRGAGDSGAYDPMTLPGADGTLVGATVARQDTIGVGASYELGNVTLAGAWSRSINGGVADADSGAPLASIAFSNYEANATWQLTPALSLAGMYVYTNASNAHWHSGAVQGVYQLSKRTDVYAQALYQRASSGASAVISTNDPSSGRNQLMVATGIRHRF